jgi:ankyrin repeat protein
MSKLLLLAALGGNGEIVKLLLPVSDPKHTKNYSYTALMFATLLGHEEIVKLLLPVSDVKATSKKNSTTLLHITVQ